MEQTLTPRRRPKWQSSAAAAPLVVAQMLFSFNGRMRFEGVSFAALMDDGHAEGKQEPL